MLHSHLGEISLCGLLETTGTVLPTSRIKVSSFHIDQAEDYRTAPAWAPIGNGELFYGFRDSLAITWRVAVPHAVPHRVVALARTLNLFPSSTHRSRTR